MPRRGENIYKRKDGRWEGRYIESYSSDGKAKYHSVYAHSYSEVKSKLKNYRTNYTCRTIHVTAGEWIEGYIESRKQDVKISTYQIYQRYLNNHILPFFKEIELYRLNQGILQDFIDSQKMFSPSTVRGTFSIVREALKSAYHKGYIDRIWTDIKLPRIKKSNIHVFTKKEQGMIENELNPNEDPNDIGILICLYSGLRIGELCGLKWEDLNFPSGTLSVRRTVQRLSIDGKSRLIELQPKSECSRREIPLPGFLLEYLREIKEISDNPYILNMHSHRMDPRTYQNQYKRILKRAGVDYTNFHTLRHTFSVRALEVGFDIKTLSEILGHSNAGITLSRYAHSLDEHKRNSMERLSFLHTGKRLSASENPSACFK